MKMKITIKQLQGKECSVEVTATTTILEIKQEIEKQLKIPVESQRLLLLGKTLADEKSISTYPAIKDGTKLNLAVKKPDDLYEAALKEYKKIGMGDVEAAKAASRVSVVMKEKLQQLSLDDLNRLSLDFLMVKDGIRSLRLESDTEEPSAL